MIPTYSGFQTNIFVFACFFVAYFLFENQHPVGLFIKLENLQQYNLKCLVEHPPFKLVEERKN